MCLRGFERDALGLLCDYESSHFQNTAVWSQFTIIKRILFKLLPWGFCTRKSIQRNDSQGNATDYLFRTKL